MELIKFATENGLFPPIYKLLKRYFQLEVLNGENIFKSGNPNCMIVMNHTAFFGLEVYLLGTYILAHQPDFHFKTLVWKGFTEGPAGLWFKSLGCQSAKLSTGIDLLKAGDNVLILPEGVDATDVRNQFNVFHTGYLRMLAENPVPIVPIGFYGVDEAIPWFVSHNEHLVKLTTKKVMDHFDFFLFPKPPLPRPVKIVYKVGNPIHLTADMLDTEEKIRSQNDKIRHKIEDLVFQAQAHRKQTIQSNPINAFFHKLLDGKITVLDDKRS